MLVCQSRPAIEVIVHVMNQDGWRHTIEIRLAYLGRKARFGYVRLREPSPGERPQIGAFEAVARYDLTSGCFP